MTQFAADPEQRYRCRTCGALISTTGSLASLLRGEDGIRVGECAICAGPQVHDQLEDLLDAGWKAEENWRFDDRLRIGDGVPLPATHRCDPPKNAIEDNCYREWRCGCGQRWVKPGWYSAYQPADG